MAPATAADPGAADALAAQQAALLASRAAAVPLPSPALDGWSSLAAAEYARAVLALRAHAAGAIAALRSAGAP